MHIPGVDYTEIFSPVATDRALRILVGIVLFYNDRKWECHYNDVEAAFLELSLKNNFMFIELPPGIFELGFLTEKEVKDYCIQLNNSMYGNVDAALRWILLKTEYLTNEEVGMIQSRADPCVFFKKDESGEPTLIMAITVDDCMVAGNPKAIDWLMTKIEKEI